jgi:hypothetical protein
MNHSTQAFSMRPKLLAGAVRQVHDQREKIVAADVRVLATETAYRVGTFIHAITKAANVAAKLSGPLASTRSSEKQDGGPGQLQPLVSRCPPRSSPGTGSTAGTLASTRSYASRLPRAARPSRYSNCLHASSFSRTASATHADSPPAFWLARRATSACNSAGNSTTKLFIVPLPIICNPGQTQITGGAGRLPQIPESCC